MSSVGRLQQLDDFFFFISRLVMIRTYRQSSFENKIHSTFNSSNFESESHVSVISNFFYLHEIRTFAKMKPHDFFIFRRLGGVFV